MSNLKTGYILKEEYKIERVLGEGGFGITYLAQDLNLEQKVVIKEFFPQSISRREESSHSITPFGEGKNIFSHLIDRFMEEAKLLAKLKHPNIVRVTSLFKGNNTVYFVMEYEEGETLSNYLKRYPILKEKDIIKIIMPIIEGIKYTHSRGILHRDIAPDNIFLKKNAMPMLIDFGSARNAIANESQTLSAIAKDGYSPPEQYTENKEQTPATDVYSLGAVIFKMITGKKPLNSTQRQIEIFDGEEDIVTKELLQNKGKYSNKLIEATIKALQISQKNRFDTVDKLQVALIKEKEVKKEKIKRKTIRKKENKKEEIKTKIIKEKGLFPKNKFIPSPFSILAIIFISLLLFSSIENRELKKEKERISLEKKEERKRLELEQKRLKEKKERLALQKEEERKKFELEQKKLKEKNERLALQKEEERKRLELEQKKFREENDRLVVLQKENEMLKIDGLTYQNQPFHLMKWKEAKIYCLNLELGGYSDWRLPTRKELNKLANIKLYGTSYDNHKNWKKWFNKNKHKRNKNSRGDSFFIKKEFIENIPTYLFWVWTLEEGYNNAWIVNFSRGYDFLDYKTLFIYVLCVRE